MNFQFCAKTLSGKKPTHSPGCEFNFTSSSAKAHRCYFTQFAMLMRHKSFPESRSQLFSELLPSFTRIPHPNRNLRVVNCKWKSIMQLFMPFLGRSEPRTSSRINKPIILLQPLDHFYLLYSAIGGFLAGTFFVHVILSVSSWWSHYASIFFLITLWYTNDKLLYHKLWFTIVSLNLGRSDTDLRMMIMTTEVNRGYNKICPQQPTSFLLRRPKQIVLIQNVPFVWESAICRKWSKIDL